MGKLNKLQGPYSRIKSKSKNLKTFYSLNPNDVLCGRGNGINMREGNIIFRNHVDKLRPSYTAARRQDKIHIARKVVQLVQDKGGRFLRFKGDTNEEVYIEIGYERAVEKACQALRENCNQRQQAMREELAKQAIAKVKAATKAAAKEKAAARAAKQSVAKAPTPSSSSSRSNATKKSPASSEVKVKSTVTAKAKSKTPAKKSNPVKVSRPKPSAGNKKKSLWQGRERIPIRRRSSASGGQLEDPTDDDEEEDSDIPEMDESTVSDNGSESPGGEDTEKKVAPEQRSPPRSKSSLLQHPATRRSAQTAAASPCPSQSPRPPMHRLMMQSPMPPKANKPVEPSGWFCDFMNGGTTDPSSPSYQTYWESLFRSLVTFMDVHGHAAIPPSAGSPHATSSKEEREHARLADWASVQRTIYREIQNGRREATEEEKVRFRRLEAVGFVWNYEEWHWNRRYQELVEFQRKEQGAEDANENCEDKGTNPRKDPTKCLGLALWVKQQRQLYLEGLQGKIASMRSDRVQKLENINFSWAAGSSLYVKPKMMESIAQKKNSTDLTGAVVSKGSLSVPATGPSDSITTSSDKSPTKNYFHPEGTKSNQTSPTNATETATEAATVSPETPATAKNSSLTDVAMTFSDVNSTVETPMRGATESGSLAATASA